MSGWVFRSYGRIEQYQIETEADLERIDQLDEARWAATSAPCEAFQCDKAFLALADADQNGRIRVNEVKALRAWAWSFLARRERLVKGSDVLRLDDLNPQHAEAAGVRSLAAHLLERLGSGSTGEISLAQVRTFRAEYVRRFPNGDGVVTAGQVDEALRPLLGQIVAVSGGATDLSGEVGLRQADVGTWRERSQAFLAWKARETQEAAALFPLGEQTPAAAALLTELAPKVERFFAQCALLRFESGAADRLAVKPETLAAIDIENPGAIDAFLDGAPLGKVNPEGVLALVDGVNARWAARLKQLSEAVAPGLLKVEGAVATLDRAQWDALNAGVAAWRAWSGSRPAGIAADATAEGVQASLADPGAERLAALAVEDTSVAQELVQFNNLEKVVLVQRWLFEFANNFVSFPQLFAGDQRALFEMGTLILDGRRVDLCFLVTDLGGHKAVAQGSQIFVVYLELTRKEGTADQTMKVAAAVTAGVRGGIAVGKRGVFYDREKREWDARIVDLVVQPISLWEAAIAPFLRVRDAVASRFEGLVGSQAAAMEGQLGAQVDATQASVAAPPAPAPAPEPAGGSGQGFQNLMIGGSLALAAIGSALAFVVQTVAGISPLTLVLSLGSVAGLVFLISGFVGWLKLRARDVATVLEAGGFALNGRMYLTFHLASLLTKRPGLPPGATRRWMVPRGVLGRVLVTLAVLILLGVLCAWYAPEWLATLPGFAPEPPPAEVIPEAAPAAG